jgi:hypothetical protein
VRLQAKRQHPQPSQVEAVSSQVDPVARPCRAQEKHSTIKSQHRTNTRPTKRTHPALCSLPIPQPSSPSPCLARTNLILPITLTSHHIILRPSLSFFHPARSCMEFELLGFSFLFLSLSLNNRLFNRDSRRPFAILDSALQLLDFELCLVQE